MGNTTTLTGAVIASPADTDKNTLSTKQLEMKDVENKASYTYTNVGLGYNHFANPKDANGKISNRVYNKMGLTPDLSPGSTKTVTSTTRSAVSDGTIVADGKQLDTKTINTNTEERVHTLSKIFDRKKIEERQLLAKYFAQNAMEAVHRLGDKAQEEVDKYNREHPNDPPKTNPWRDGGVRKILLHGAIAEITTLLAGNEVGSGAFAGAVNEAAINAIVAKVAKNHPDMAQMLSAALGGTVNYALGKPVVAGAAVAQYGTKFNNNLDWQLGSDERSENAENWGNYYNELAYDREAKKILKGKKLIGVSGAPSLMYSESTNAGIYMTPLSYSHGYGKNSEENSNYYRINGLSIGFSAAPVSYTASNTYSIFGGSQLDGLSVSLGANVLGGKTYSLSPARSISNFSAMMSEDISTTPSVSFSVTNVIKIDVDKYKIAKVGNTQIDYSTYDYNQPDGLFALPNNESQEEETNYYTNPIVHEYMESEEGKKLKKEIKNISQSINIKD